MRRHRVLISALLLGAPLLNAWAALPASPLPSAETQARANAESWEALGRADLAQLALNKLLLTRPNDPDLLFEIGQLDLRLNQIDSAQTVLQRLRKLAPEAPETTQMALAYRAASRDRLQMAGIRRLIELNKPGQAIAELHKLFPDGPPDGDLGVEYYRILFEAPGQRAAARAGIAAIAKRYPLQPRYRIALADLLTRDPASRTAGLRLLQQASAAASEPSPKLLDVWHRSLLRGAPDAASRASARAYLGLKPDDTEVLAWLHRPPPRAVQAAVTRPEDRLAAQVGELLRAGHGEEALRRLDAAGAGNTPNAPLATLRAAALGTRASEERLRGDAAAARETLLQALRLAPSDIQLRLNLVDVLLASKDVAAAQVQIDETLRRSAEAGDSTAQSRRLHAAALGLAADVKDAEDEHGAALALIESAQALTPEDPWLRYRLARRYLALDLPGEARELMAEGAEQASGKRAIDAHYAQALLLASLDDVAGARQALSAIPEAERSDGMRALQRRLTVTAARKQADRLRLAGDPRGVSAALAGAADAAVDDAESVRSLASAWRGLDQPRQGLALIDRAAGSGLALTPELRVLRAELLDDAGDDSALSAALPALREDRELSLSQQQRVSAIEDRQELRLIERLRKRGDDDAALARLDAALARKPANAALHDARAELQLDHRRYAAALADLRAVVAGSDEAWRVSRANDRITDIQARRDGFVALAPSLREKPGSAGRSQYSDLEIPFEVDYPIGYDQHLFVHADQVNTSAGTLPADYDEAALYGQVQARGPQSLARFPEGAKQSADGTALALGYRSDVLRVDLGTTPLGFPVQDVVGGVRYSDRFGKLNLTADLARRPVTSSLLAYAGAVDPATGEVWGGVRDNRLRLRLAEYGPRLSLSGSLEAGVAAGRKVDANTHVQASANINWRAFDWPTQRIFVGLSGNYWHYDKNLEDYSFGHGGYYSPQQYLSLGLPVEWNGRIGRWTYTLRGALSLSHSRVDAAPFYPGDAGLQALAQASPLPAGFSAPVYDGRSGFGFGRSLRGDLEYAVSPHWSVGGSFDIDRSAYFSPNFFSLYLRRSFRPHDLLRAFPPSPPEPYSGY